MWWFIRTPNSMHIEKSENYELIHTILTTPELYHTVGNSRPVEEFLVDRSFDYLLICEEKQILGCFQIREFNKNIVECHINILPKYWGKGVAETASKLGFKWLEDNTTYFKALTDVPVDCEIVHRLSLKLGWNPCGMMKQAVIYDGHVTDLILYDYNIRVL